MLTETIEVPGQGTADRLQAIKCEYELNLATGKQSLRAQWCLANATTTFFGPGTVTKELYTGDMVAFIGTYPAAASDLAAVVQPTLAASYWLAKSLNLSLATGERIHVE